MRRPRRAATAVQKHVLPRSYLVEVGGQRIRSNRVALRNDSTKSHMGHREHHENIIQQGESESDKTHVVPRFPARFQISDFIIMHYLQNITLSTLTETT